MGQGHDIGDGTQCRQVAIVLDHLIAVILFQGADQLERHTHAGQPLEWAGTIGAMRVHHSHCIGQGLPGLVMIGHHHINAQTVGMGDLLMGRNAVIHCDDQPDPPDIVQKVDGFGVEAIAFLLPVGDIVDHIGAHRLQIAVQQRCGGDAVAIVVAVDHDEFARFHRQANAFHRPVHIPEQERVKQGVLFPVQRLDLLQAAYPTGTQYPGAERRKSCRLQRSQCLRVRCPAGCIPKLDAQILPPFLSSKIFPGLFRSPAS